MQGQENSNKTRKINLYHQVIHIGSGNVEIRTEEANSLSVRATVAVGSREDLRNQIFQQPGADMDNERKACSWSYNDLDTQSPKFLSNIRSKENIRYFFFQVSNGRISHWISSIWHKNSPVSTWALAEIHFYFVTFIQEYFCISYFFQFVLVRIVLMDPYTWDTIIIFLQNKITSLESILYNVSLNDAKDDCCEIYFWVITDIKKF